MMTTAQQSIAPAISSPSFDPMPPIACEGAPVQPDGYVEPGTGLQVFVGYFVAGLAVLIGGICTYTVLWIALLFSPLIDWAYRKRNLALLRGSAVEVGPHQYPEIYKCAVAYAQRLGMNGVPMIFVVEGNTINATAMRIGGRKVIMLIDDVVDACLRSGDPQALAFIIGHEMAHHALGHTKLVRALLGKYHLKLARLDELSCDAIAHRLVGNSRSAVTALITMLTGPQLLRFTNVNQLLTQAAEVAQDKHSLKAERKLSHPLLLRRIARLQD